MTSRTDFDSEYRSRAWLRVLHVIARMPPAGTERQLAGMLRVAHRRHWDATLCVLYPGDPLTEEVKESGVPVVEVGGGRLSPAWQSIALRRLIRSGRYDVVHSSLWGANALTRLLAAGWRRPATVVSERRVEDFRPARRRRLDRILRSVTDEYVGNSAAVVEFIQRAHGVRGERVHVVPNGVDRNIFHPPTERQLPEDGPRRLGALGRLVHQKGFDVLIEALPKVLAEHDVELLIAGQGELSSRLKQQAIGLPVRFVGLLDSPSKVANFLRSLDLFVMPSRYEGLPNAVIEATACGADIVATDAPGMRAALGRMPLVPTDDADALAIAIVGALYDSTPIPTTRLADFDDVAEAHARVFESAATRRSQRRDMTDMSNGRRGSQKCAY